MNTPNFENLAGENLRRILAVRLDNIGDVVTLSASLRVLRENFPTAEITLLCTAAGEKVAPLLRPFVNQIIVKSVLWQDTKNSPAFSPLGEQDLIREIAARNFDAAFIFTSFSQSPFPAAYVCYLAGVPIRVGQSKEFGGAVLSHAIKPLPDAAHQAERSLHLLEAVGLTVENRFLELVVPPDVKAATNDKLRQANIAAHNQFLVFAPGATCAARRYDLERYAEAARILLAQTDFPIVVVGSEKEREMCRPVLQIESERIKDFVGDSSVSELAAILERARLIVCNDSGPMHIAEAFGVPQIVMFSGTELESQWTPRRSPVRLLRVPTPCAPCYKFVCDYEKYMACLDIAPATVAAETLQLLAQTEIRANFAAG